MKVVKTISPSGQNVRPMGIVVAPDGKRVFVTTGRFRSVEVIDAASDSIVQRIRNVGERPWGIAFSPDGTRLYTANGPSNDLSIIDVPSMAVIAKVQAGQSPWGVVIGP